MSSSSTGPPPCAAPTTSGACTSPSSPTRSAWTTQQLRSLATGSAGDPCWSDPGDRAVLAAVDELHASNDLSDEAWAALVAATGDDAALDLTLLCGWYHAISYAVRALRLDLEPGTAPIPR